MASALNRPPRPEPTPFWMWKLRLQTSSLSTGPSQYEHPDWKVPNQLLGSPPPWHCYLLPTAGDQRHRDQKEAGATRGPECWAHYRDVPLPPLAIPHPLVQRFSRLPSWLAEREQKAAGLTR